MSHIKGKIRNKEENENDNPNREKFWYWSALNNDVDSTIPNSHVRYVFVSVTEIKP